MGSSDTKDTEYRANWTLKDRRILIVDDDTDHSHLLRDILEEHQAKVTAVENGEQCLALDFADFDMVLLDFYLPDTTGGELVVEILRKRNIPIIMITVEKSHDVAVGAIRLGAADYVCKAGDYLRILPAVLMKNFDRFQMESENESLRGQLEKLVEENESQNETLEQLSTLDPLTLLKNHRCMHERLKSEINLAGRHLHSVSVILADIDALGQLNTDFGAEGGDLAIKKMAELFLEETQENSGVAGRLGGGEFMLILPGSEMIEAVMVAQRLRMAIEEAQIESEGEVVKMTASFGVAGFNSQEFAGRDELIKLADRALLHSKEEGGDRVSWPE